jgi:hypothetical protein
MVGCLGETHCEEHYLGKWRYTPIEGKMKRLRSRREFIEMAS